MILVVWTLEFGCRNIGFWMCVQWILVAWMLDLGCLGVR